ncbi:alpha/beta fold hydrolase [Nonomuraea diastatica]|uniref:Alpha/beta hydrolase n=1 Tax=Nonomuraea diastatica TaxID=1848329 RepID=A0A4R4X6L0_9ACTN|nr:alpha/beta hydrolase [Nonomuraea diastatica]TDD25955.1 alpha/beta hydrolase [Nonomuraea diastatica]
MPSLSAHDGAVLAYHVYGDGSPLICLPGGPMLPSACLGELGGLSAHKRLIMLDLRGTGGSATPADTSAYRCDRLVDDVEALRLHLGLDRIDLLGHSAGANLAVRYTARHPEHTGRLALITPSTRAVGIEISGEWRRETARLRAGEPWFARAYAGLEAATAGTATADDWEAITPFTYGRWDAAAQAHHAADEEQRNDEAAAAFGGEGAFEPAATRAALAAFGGPVLLLAGEVDVAAPLPAMTEYAGLFKDATLTVQPGAGHFPWLDDADRFVSTVAAFLS